MHWKVGMKMQVHIVNTLNGRAMIVAPIAELRAMLAEIHVPLQAEEPNHADRGTNPQRDVIEHHSSGVSSSTSV
jgi:hypothetical protein